jgi:hypothetical protein
MKPSVNKEGMSGSGYAWQLRVGYLSQKPIIRAY